MSDGFLPTGGLDPLIHAPTRLAIVALLAPLREAEFARVRDGVGVSDSVLSKQVSQLEEAGYVRVRKGHVGKRPRTWVALTGAGRAAFGAHVAALRAILDAAERAPAADADPREGADEAAAAGASGRGPAR